MQPVKSRVKHLVRRGTRPQKYANAALRMLLTRALDWASVWDCPLGEWAVTASIALRLFRSVLRAPCKRRGVVRAVPGRWIEGDRAADASEVRGVPDCVCECGAVDHEVPV